MLYFAFCLRVAQKTLKMEVETTTNIQTVECVLPMANRYTRKEFYVRPCYAEYYDLIVTLLENTMQWKESKDQIIVTGTPGIGKSIFYIYFFQRWRRENPSSTVVVASFYDDRSPPKCFVFNPTDRKGVKINFSQAEDYPEALHLYDGVPSGHPADFRMVCFTSPNRNWLYSLRKNFGHIALYMPLWTLEELQDANAQLKLGIEPETIYERFQFVGGTARYCLCVQGGYYNQNKSMMSAIISQLESYTKILDCLKNATDSNCLIVCST